MKEILKCPECGSQTIKERRIYPPDEIRNVALDEYAKRIIEQEKHKNDRDHIINSSSGDVLFRDFPIAKQIVFECYTCGFVKVYDV